MIGQQHGPIFPWAGPLRAGKRGGPRSPRGERGPVSYSHQTLPTN
ncbi:hypothetical protein FM106_04545 [Brachybacterium faecium]|nr:hypothetical protein FM106_04545 [Brachybacterium faecium]